MSKRIKKSAVFPPNVIDFRLHAARRMQRVINAADADTMSDLVLAESMQRLRDDVTGPRAFVRREETAVTAGMFAQLQRGVLALRERQSRCSIKTHCPEVA